MQKRDFKTYQKHFRDFKILPKFSKLLTFFVVPFATPECASRMIILQSTPSKTDTFGTGSKCLS